MRRSILAAIVVGIVAATAAGILVPNNSVPNKPQAMPDQSRIRIIASFYPLYEFSKNIAGAKADVSVFVPVGVEPHDWEPSTGDVLDLDKSNVFVYNGAGMETFVDKLTDSGQYQNVSFVDTTSGLDLIAAQDAHAKYDPHVWLDPILAKHQVAMIRDALIKADPANAQYYTDNAAAYSAKLDSLDSKIRAGLSHCSKNTFMPFHNAFSYFASRYGLQVHSLSGIDPESEPTAADLKEFIDYVRNNDIKVVFSEELIDPKLANVLADEAGVQVLVFSPVEGLSQADVSAGKTYIEKMEENLDHLRTALECQ